MCVSFLFSFLVLTFSDSAGSKWHMASPSPATEKLAEKLRDILHESPDSWVAMEVIERSILAKLVRGQVAAQRVERAVLLAVPAARKTEVNRRTGFANVALKQAPEIPPATERVRGTSGVARIASDAPVEQFHDLFLLRGTAINDCRGLECAGHSKS